MRYLLCLSLALTPFALVTAADPAPKHNRLTAKEAAEGWILLFNGEDTLGWTALEDGKWSVVEGMLARQGDKPQRLLSTTAFADYDLSFDYLVKTDSKADLVIGCDAQGHTADGEKTGALPLAAFGSVWTTVQATVRQGQLTGYRVQTRNRGMGQTYQPTNPPRVTSGYIAFSGNNFITRNIKLKPFGEKPLFNGKNLDGWKVFAGTSPKVKSEFTVTPEGTISLKNGPGDLQSKEAWADFVLQIECISNGKQLNSGVFFRCIPDQYQNGYEAQIHNGFTDKPLKKYKIEEYDPKTNMLKATRELFSTATDYGTGAIYRRMPARCAVAHDQEWFTMTIAAQGRHLATWVNGVQVVDWTDNRPLNETPRNGCRLEKGPISLQGHDATTDLNFRNIRLAPLPPPR